MSTETQWIDMPGGLGDALLLSGIIKLAHDRLGKKYNVIRRTISAEMLAGHPGIERIDYLQKGAPVMTVAGMDEESHPRAFQRLAKMFGLELPAPETLYLPLDGISDAMPASLIPWRTKNVAIAPDSASPRKMMSRSKWDQVAKALGDSGALVVQFGKGGAEKVKHAYSLAGITTPKEAVMLLKRMDLLITSDNFLMHAAHMTGTPTISLWGSADAALNGYPEHQKITAVLRHEPTNSEARPGAGLSSPEQSSCMDNIDTNEIVDRALKSLASGRDKK